MFSSSAQKHGKSEGENRGSKKNRTEKDEKKEKPYDEQRHKQHILPCLSLWRERLMKTDKRRWGMKKQHRTEAETTAVKAADGQIFTFQKTSWEKMERGRNQKRHETETVKRQTCCLICESLLCILQKEAQLRGQSRQSRKRREVELVKKKEGNNKRRVENSDKRSKYLIKKQNDFLFPCNTACMKAVKVAQKKKKRRNPAYPEDHGQSEPDHVYFLNSWKKETLLWTEDFMWKQPFVISVQDVRLLLAVISFVVWKKAIKPPITATTDLPEPTLVVWLTVMLVPSVAVKWCPGSNGVRPLKLTEAIPRKSPFLSWTVWKIPPSSCRGRPAIPWALKSKSVNFKGYLTSLKYNNYTAIETLVKLPKKHGGLNEKHLAGFLFLFHPLWCLSACYQVGF